MGKGGAGKGKAPWQDEVEDEEEEDEEDDIAALQAESDDDVHLFGSQASEEAARGNGDEALSEADGDVARSPFGPETFPSAKACWDHAAECYGFSLTKLRAEVGLQAWTDYHRIRLVNHLRSVGHEAARREAPRLTRDSPIWTDDSLLQPQLEDDLLLFEDDDDDDEEDGAPGVPGGAPGPGRSEQATAASQAEAPTAGGAALGADTSASSPAELQQEVVRLRAECAGLRRLLSMADGDGEGDVPAVAASRRTGGSDSGEHAARAPGGPGDAEDDLDVSRALVQDPALGEAFRQMVLASPELLEDKRVLSAGCGAGVLSCLCAKLGAHSVAAVDPSPVALAAARAVLAANDYDAEVVLVQGRADGDLPELLESQPRGGGKKGGGGERSSPCFDVMVSERFLGDLRYAPPLLHLLAARRRWLKPGGRVLPTRVGVWVCAADFSQEASAAEAWQKPVLGGMNLAGLAPYAAAASTVDAERVSSVQPAELLSLDLASASPEEALSPQVPFCLELRPDRCTTALVVYLEAQLGEEAGAGKVSAAPNTGGARHRQVVLRLPAPGPPPARALRLPGAEFPRLEGRLSASLERGGERLAISASVVARGKGGSELLSSTVVSVA